MYRKRESSRETNESVEMTANLTADSRLSDSRLNHFGIGDGKLGVSDVALQLLHDVQRADTVERMITPHEDPADMLAKLSLEQDMFVNTSSDPHNFSGYVNVADILPEVADHHFGVHDGMNFLVAQNAEKFRFQRLVRRSLLMTLGLENDTQTDTTVIDLYTKSSNKDARTVFMALIIGFGSLSLPQAVATLGIVPGLGALVGLSFLNWFICNRIVETPQFLERNFENLIQSVDVIFNNGQVVRMVILISVLAWMMPIILYFATLPLLMRTEIATMDSFRQLAWFNSSTEEIGLKKNEWSIVAAFYAFVASCLVYFFLKVRGMKTIIGPARLAWWSMMMLGIVQIVASLWRLARVWQVTGHFPNIKISGDEASIAKGLESMFLAYGGIIIIPYIAAEMTSPEGAKKVFSQASMRISAYYIVVGVVGYVCWADIYEAHEAEGQPDTTIELIGTLYNNTKGMSDFEDVVFASAGTFCNFLLMVRGISGMPIIIWPMMREFKFLFSYFEDPAIELQLPWANKREKRRRSMWRVSIFFLIVSAVIVLNMGKQSSEDPTNDIYQLAVLLGTVIAVLPTFLMSLLLPTAISLFAIWRHWNLLEVRQVRKFQIDLNLHRGCMSCHSLPNAKSIRYFGGSYCMHLSSTFAAFVAIIWLLVFTSDGLVTNMVFAGDAWLYVLGFAFIVSLMFFWCGK